MALMITGYRYSTIQECLTQIYTEDAISGPYYLHSFVGKVIFDVQRAEILFVASAVVVLLLYGHIYTATACGAWEHAPATKALATGAQKGALATRMCCAIIRALNTHLSYMNGCIRILELGVNLFRTNPARGAFGGAGAHTPPRQALGAVYVCGDQ
jgi:hypothetical protein